MVGGLFRRKKEPTSVEPARVLKRARVERLGGTRHPLLFAKARFLLRQPEMLDPNSRALERFERLVEQSQPDFNRPKGKEKWWAGVFTGVGGTWRFASGSVSDAGGQGYRKVCTRNTFELCEWEQGFPTKRTFIRRGPFGLSMVQAEWREKGKLQKISFGKATKRDIPQGESEKLHPKPNGEKMGVRVDFRCTTIYYPTIYDASQNPVKKTETLEQGFHFLPSKKP